MGSVSSVGMNLASNNYWSTEFPFIDRMKTAGTWSYSGGDGSPVQVDSNGYPVKIPAGASGIYTMVALDPVSAGTNHTYVLTYTGTADFLITGGQIVSREPGKITFTYASDDNQAQVSVWGLDPNAPLTDMHIVRSDQQDLFAKGEIFNPAFTSKVSSFDTLRYMDWANTNVTAVTNWADRTKSTSLSWQDSGNSSVPLEVMVALANETKTNMWLNVPTQASDDYVRQMVSYVHDHLDPSLSVNLEYTNEAFNWAAGVAGYTKAQGDAIFAPDGGNWMIWYGYRAAQVASIANGVYGSDSDRLHNVLSTQTAWLGLENYVIDGVSRANVGSVSSLFDDYSVTTYFGNLSGNTANDQATVLSWAKSGDAGLTAAFAAMKDGTGIESFGSLKGLQPIYAYQAAVAAKLGLNLVGYEGGAGMTATNYLPGDQQTVLAFFAKMEADPRMGDLLTQMVGDFSAAGGTLANVFDDAGPDSAWGTWGQLKTIYDNGSPAWDALVAAEQASKADMSTGTASPVPTPVTPAPTGTAPPASSPVAPAPTGTAPPASSPVAPAPTGTTPIANSDSNVAKVDRLYSAVLGRPADTIEMAFWVHQMDTGVALNDVANYFVTSAGFQAKAGELSDSDFVNYMYKTVLGRTADQGGYNYWMTQINNGMSRDDLLINFSESTEHRALTSDIVPASASGSTGTAPTVAASIANPNSNVAQVDRLYSAVLGRPADAVETAFWVHQMNTGVALTDVANYFVTSAGFQAKAGGLSDSDFVNYMYKAVLGRAADQGGYDYWMTQIKDGMSRDDLLINFSESTEHRALTSDMNDVRTNLSSYSLPDRVENLTYIGVGNFTGIGNDSDNELTGGAGDDYLDGGKGGDRMVGGDGSDIYIVDDARDQVIEAPNSGWGDEVRTSLNTYVLPDNVERLTFTGIGSFDAVGNDTDNVIIGSNSGSNRLMGGAGNDQLMGGAGNDWLDGGTGADRMGAGVGDDTYVVDNPGDLVIEYAGGGTDTVNSTISYTLPDAVENLNLTGNDAIDGTGNELANTIVGNAADNHLYGGAGNDTLVGGAGADTLTGGAGADRFTFQIGDLNADPARTDTITDFSHADGDKIDLSALAATIKGGAFSFIGSSGFGKHAGELKVEASNGYQLVSGDLDGDGVADFTIKIQAGSTLAAADFAF